MPAKSEAQRRYLNAKFGHEWVKKHHFDNKGKLPVKVGGKKSKPKKSGNRGQKITKNRHGTTVTYGSY